MVQFAVALRDPAVADPGSGSNGFESDNDASGSTDAPLTTPVFSNVSMFGPLVTPETNVNANYKRAMHLRRNTSVSIFNTIFAGYMTGLFIDGTASQANATNGDLNVRNVTMAGCKSFYAAEFDSIYFVNPENHDQTAASNEDLQITDPFNLEAPDFMPLGGSPALFASIWYEEIPSDVTDMDSKKISASIYPNPFHETAILSIDLDATSQVSIKLYDVKGILIKSIANERRATGRHEFILQVAQKGVYFADIMVNGNKQVVKLISH